MKLTFEWRLAMGYLSLGCSSDVVSEEGYSPFAYILNDDGGLRPLDTLPWLVEGLERLYSVKELKVDFVIWGREAWSAEFNKAYVKVYSLYDDNVFEIVSVDSFEKALLAWIDFIQSPQIPGVSQEVEV